MVKQTIIEKYRELTEDIAVIKTCISSTERDIKKTINTYQPSDIAAIDYSKPVVQTSCSQENLTVVYQKIHDLETELQNLKDELDFLYKQRDELEKAINDLGDVKKQIIMHKIKGVTNYKIASKFNYSLRRIYQIIEECEVK